MESVLLAPNEVLPFSSPHYRWPMLGSPKMDGNRLFLIDGKLLTRSMKPQPNRQLEEHLKDIIAYSKEKGLCFDGELYDHNTPFVELQTYTRSKNIAIPDHIFFNVFDCLSLVNWNIDISYEVSYCARCEHYDDIIEKYKFPHVTSVTQYVIENARSAEGMYEKFLQDGYEGMMLRSLNGRYKKGRATLSEGIMFKVKPKATIDAVLIDVFCRRAMLEEIRTGPRPVDERGLLRRSHKQGDFEDTDIAGAFLVRDEQGREFKVGFARGFGLEMRKQLWDQRNMLIGRWVEVVYLPIGEKDVPRSGRFVRFRDDK